jgi:type II secretory pathway pseudopilin PulG
MKKITSSKQMYAERLGFTLVETLVAITILLLVIIGPITIAQKGVQNAYYANNQMTAIYLAQEAIEAVRRQRDQVALDVVHDGAGDTWSWYTNSGVLASACKVTFPYSDTVLGCAFDIDNNTFVACSSSNYYCQLKIDTGGHYISAGAGSDSPYTRKVFIGSTDIINGNVGIPVTVEVSWTARIFGGSTQRTVKLQTWVYDQYQRFEE